MKKFLIAILSVTMICGLVGCGNKEVPNSGTEDVTQTPSTEEVTSNVVYEDDDFTLTNDKTSAEVIVNADKTWELGFYDENFIKIENADSKYVITPVAEGNASVDFILNGDTQVIYATIIGIDANKEMNISVEKIEVLGTDEPITPEVDATLESMINTIYEGMPADSYPPSVASRMIDTANVDEMMYNLGVDTITGVQKAIISEPMMSSIAYSLVILEFDNADNAKAATTTLIEKAPKAKWVCVEAEDVLAKVVKDNYVIVAMSSVDTVKAIDSIVIE